MEERVELVEFLRQKRIEFVVVTLGATDRDAQPDRAQRVDTIHDVLVDILVRVGAALVVGHVVADEPGGEALLARRGGEQVACQLLDGECVVGLVPIECVDHPVAPQPHEAHTIEVIAGGVGVARQVQPVRRQPFTVMLRVQQTIHQFLVGLR